MRILCCYATLHPATADALSRFAPDAELVDVAGDDGDYWRAIMSRWTGEDDLLIVEHDIEIHAGVLPQLEACREPWCVFPYPLNGYMADRCLGCTRFSATLQRQVTPEQIQAGRRTWLVAADSAPVTHIGDITGGVTVTSVPCRCGDPGMVPCWRHIDELIWRALAGPVKLAAPFRPHVHAPPVTHCHSYDREVPRSARPPVPAAAR